MSSGDLLELLARVGLLGVALGAMLSLGISSFAGAHLVRFLRSRDRSRRPVAPAELPAISILKPLRGVDEGLFDNLEALARQDYPAFELILGCEDVDDPALPVAARLQRQHPEVPIRVVAGAPKLGWNPKVNNLVALAGAARHELLLISDSNVRPRPGYLRAMAAELADERVGLVGSLFCGAGEATWGARIENLLWSTFVTPVVAAAAHGRRPVVVGKSMLFRRSDLARAGGFASVADVLAEDDELARRFAAVGLGIAISPHVVPVRHERRTLREVAERHLRWGLMRRKIAPLAHLGEPLLLPTPWLVALVFGGWLQGGFGALSVGGLAALGGAALALRAVADAVLAAGLAGRRASLCDLLAVPVKDCAALGFWAGAFFRSHVCWRGHALRVGAGSRLEAVDDDSVRSFADPELAVDEGVAS